MKVLPFFAVVCFVLSMISCSNDFEFNAEKRDIPIVHALFDYEDANHYLRLERAFIDDKISALDLALIPDSIYYPNAEVFVSVNGSRRQLELIDGETEGFPRNTGIFADQPNLLYKLGGGSSVLRPNDKIDLEIELNNGEEMVLASSVILDDIEIRSPGPTSPINLVPNRPVNLSWRHEADGADRLFEVKLRFDYRELDGVSGEFVDKFLEIPLGQVRNEQELRFEGVTFFEALSAAIDETNVTTRLIGDMRIEIIGAGAEIVDAIRIENANSGITSSQEIPTYSNLSRGIGIFSSRKRIAEGRILTPASRDSIREGRLTGNLGFL